MNLTRPNLREIFYEIHKLNMRIMKLYFIDKLHLSLLQANDISSPNSNKVPNLESFILLIQPPHISRDYLQIHWDTIRALSLLEPLALLHAVIINRTHQAPQLP